MHFGFTAGAGVWVAQGEDLGGGALAGGFVNLGLTQAIDLRFGLTAMAGEIEKLDAVVLVGATGAVRFNLGSVYTIALGVFMGVRSANPQVWTPGYGPYYYGYPQTVSELGVFSGPEVSLATFRFGRLRQFEIALTHGLAWPVTKSRDVDDDHLAVFYNNVSFSMLFL